MSGAQLYGRNAAVEWNLVCQEHSCITYIEATHYIYSLYKFFNVQSKKHFHYCLAVHKMDIVILSIFQDSFNLIPEL